MSTNEDQGVVFVGAGGPQKHTHGPHEPFSFGKKRHVKVQTVKWVP